MNKTGLILQNEKFNLALCELNKLEKDRKFCKHDITHLIEVARIMLKINRTENLDIEHDLIIATSLLHDLGRVNQYKFNIDHRVGGKEIITTILKECTFNKEEIDKILEAISLHKTSSSNQLADLLYRADILSRPCYLCKMKNECYWDNSIKNKRYYNWK